MPSTKRAIPAPSRFYEDGAKRLGMTPSAWRKGGAGVTIRWTIADTSLGAMLVAATDKGLCRVAFDEGEAALKEAFPACRDRRPAAPRSPIWRRGWSRACRIARARSGSAARCAGHRVPGSGVAGTPCDPGRRDAHLYRARGDCRQSQSSPRGGQCVRGEPCLDRHPLPPRAAQRRYAWRLCSPRPRCRKIVLRKREGVA